jgi:hypothetical protein
LDKNGKTFDPFADFMAKDSGSSQQSTSAANAQVNGVEQWGVFVKK